MLTFLSFVSGSTGYVTRMKVQLTSHGKLSQSEMEEVLAEVRLTVEKVYIFVGFTYCLT